MSEPTYTLYCGNCLDYMRGMDAGSVDTVITDPPYGINVDTSWLSALHVKRGKPKNKSDDLLRGDDGLLDIDFIFAFRKFLVFGYPYIKNDLATGWLVWDKWPGVENGLGNPVEMALTNLWTGFRMMRVLWAGYYRASNEIRFEHPTQKPLLLMRRIINEYTNIGDTIFDPFMGSGTTGAACIQLGRNFIGCEIEPAYYAIAERRIKDAAAQPALFTLDAPAPQYEQAALMEL